MQRKTLVVIALSVVLGAALGGGAWWMSQKPDKSATPSASPSQTAPSEDSSGTATERPSKDELEKQEVITSLASLESKLESKDVDVFVTAFAPTMRKVFTSEDGDFTWTNPPGTPCTFKPETLVVTGDKAVIELELAGEQYNQWLERINDEWYLSYATTKE